MNQTKVAEIAYEAVRAYEKSTGGESLPWSKLAPWDREGILQSVLAVQRGLPITPGADSSERVGQSIFVAVVMAA